jgi:hypothetical protein
MSDGTTLTGSESGGWLDGVSDWGLGFISNYADRWLDEEFPERTEPANPDHMMDPAVTTQGAPGEATGFQLNNKTLMIGAGLLLLVLLLK